jgi:chromosome segregation ATPase
MLVADVDKVRSEAAALRAENIRLTSQLEFQTISFNETKAMLETFKKESELTRERSTEVYSNLLAHQRRLEEVERDLLQNRERARTLEVQLDNVTREKEILAASEKRLLQETDSLRSERQSSAALLATLQNLQNEVQRAENEAKTRLQAQIDSLQRERDALRRRLETEDERYKSLLTFNQQTMDQLRAEAASEHKAYLETREALVCLCSFALGRGNRGRERECVCVCVCV